MKNFYVTLFFLFCTIFLLQFNVRATEPQKMIYKGYVADGYDNLLNNKTITVKISIVHKAENGKIVYVESHRPTTKNNGSFTVTIGEGTVLQGAFSAIQWRDAPFYLKTEIDIKGGTMYHIASMQPILSISSAIYMKSSSTLPENTMAGKTLYWNGKSWSNTPIYGADDNILGYNKGIQTWISLNNSNASLHKYVPELTKDEVYNLKTGKIWLNKNLGASRVATSPTDEASYGDLYQWGRAADGHEKRNSVTTTTISKTINPWHSYFICPDKSPWDWCEPQNDKLWQGVNGVNNPCPSGYRLPTAAEWEAEMATWSSQSSQGAFNSPLKLPVAGYRDYDGSLFNVGSDGDYWSSTVSGTYARSLYFYSSSASMSNDGRAGGNSVRCLKD